jgi:hypothetical protein
MIGEIVKMGTATVIISKFDIKVIQEMKRISPDVNIMLEAGVFDFKNGKVIIHRDQDGKLRKIDLEITKFRD